MPIIEGVVRDEYSDPIEGATVKAVKQDTDDIFETESGTDGEYTIEVDEAGEYHLLSRYENMTAITQPNINVE